MILKNSTNIAEIFWNMYCNVVSYENDFLALKSVLSNIEHDFLASGLLQQNQVNSIIWNLQKEGQRNNQQSEAELLTKKTNIQFPKPPDDPEEENKNIKKQFDKDKYPHSCNEISENIQDILHMFRDKVGKLKDTVESRNRILDLVQDKRNCYGQDQRGVMWYAKIEKDGSQFWADVNPITHKVRNCGINTAPRDWNPVTGFKMQFVNHLK